MTPNTPPPADRAAFDAAMAAIRSDHATMRRLAIAASRKPGFAADEAMSLADAMAVHERAEAQLFALPFVSHPPETVATTAARAQRRCKEYTSGNFHLPDAGAAAALFVDALLAHLAAEEAWLAHEKEHQHERLSIAA